MSPWRPAASQSQQLLFRSRELGVRDADLLEAELASPLRDAAASAASRVAVSCDSRSRDMA